MPDDSTPTAAPGAKPRALVVDDHDDTAELFGILLARLGMDVVTARSVRDALDVAERGRVDLLVSDINLPDGSGRDLLAELRKTRRMPAIAISGDSGGEEARRSREAGFDEHFVKPANVQRLIATVERLIRPNDGRDG
jgi:DNA-binding response OmpR family regulator